MENNEIILREQDIEEAIQTEMEFANVFRRNIKENPKQKALVRHKLWLNTIQHENQKPSHPYKIGVYIRYYNQTKYDDKTYLDIRKRQFAEDIALCPRWTLVDFYVDKGMTAPYMESSREWDRLLVDCFSGKVDLIVTQTVGGVSSDPDEITLISRLLASQTHPVGIYFVSEDIFTLASYYRQDMSDRRMLPEEWKTMPPDELDEPMIMEVPVLELGAGDEDELVDEYEEELDEE